MKLELTKGTGSPYGSKCVVTFMTRDQAVDAMIELQEHRYIGKATVPMSIKLCDETLTEATEPAKVEVKGTEKPPLQYKPETIKTVVTAAPVSTPSIPQSQTLVYIEYITAQGNPYYYNTVTHATQWEVPPANAVVVKPNFEPKNLPGYVQSIPANAKAINKIGRAHV